MLINIKTLWPAYAPVVAGMRGDKKLSPILNSPGDFDDKMVIVDQSVDSGPRGKRITITSRPCTHNNLSA